MSELTPVLEAMLVDADAGRAGALCVIVKTRGSTPQAPGAGMLVRSDMSTVGTLGGGCVEAEVRKRAFELLLSGRAAVLDYHLDHDFGWDDGLICGGRMFVAVRPFGGEAGVELGGNQRNAPVPASGQEKGEVRSRTTAGTEPGRYGGGLAAIREAVERARARKPAAIPLVVGDAEYRVNLEVPPTVIIAGAGHVGHAVANLAAQLDFHVVVVDERAEFVRAERFAAGVELVADDIAAALRGRVMDEGTYVVIVTRGHQHDERALDAVVRREARYIGLIGSRRKAQLIFRDLREAGVSEEQLARVHTPIGIDIGAVTVQEIAVSIVAEMVKVRRTACPELVEGPV